MFPLITEEIVVPEHWPQFMQNYSGITINKVAFVPPNTSKTITINDLGKPEHHEECCIPTLKRWKSNPPADTEPHIDEDDTWAWVLPLNPLDVCDAASIRRVIHEMEPGSRLAVWSGTLGDGLFATAPANWLSSGYEALNIFAKQVRSDLISREVRLLFLPHARHVLSDGLACLRFMREQTGTLEGEAIDKIDKEGCPFGIALSPVLLMEPSMIADAEDHIRRIIETAGLVAEVIVFEDGIVDVERDRIVVSQSGEELQDGPVWVVDWEKVKLYLQELGRERMPIVVNLIH